MLEMVVTILLGWKQVFARQRTTDRAIAQAIASACVLGRRTITATRLLRAPEPEAPRFDFCADYKLHSRAPWDAQKVFVPILCAALAHCPGTRIGVAVDDTRRRKWGTHIVAAGYTRDPLSPPFHTNLMRALRFLHAALLVPLHRQHGVAPRAVPVWFEEVAPVKKPGKTATDEQRAAYRDAIKTQNLPTSAVAMLRQLRRELDEAGARDRVLVVAADGSLTNRTLFRAELERTHLIGRVRKDAVLCRKAEPGSRRVYAAETFTPESVRQDETVAWQQARVFHGGQSRAVQYKDVTPVLWRGGSGQRALRLLVVRPVAYRLTKKGRTYYRDPAFLLTTDLEAEADDLLQIYFDRWQIEVVHRESKATFGVGDAQVRNAKAVARQPAFAMATYAALQVAALEVFGPTRTEAFGPLPKWQREKARPSCLDLIRRMRLEVLAKPEVIAPFGLRITPESLLAAAST